MTPCEALWPGCINVGASSSSWHAGGAHKQVDVDMELEDVPTAGFAGTFFSVHAEVHNFWSEDYRC